MAYLEYMQSPSKYFLYLGVSKSNFGRLATVSKMFGDPRLEKRVFKLAFAYSENLNLPRGLE